MAEDDKKLISGLSLALLYLTSWTESEDSLPRSWRSYDWDALDKLWELDYIAGNKRNKSVYLTEEGEAAAKRILAMLPEGAAVGEAAFGSGAGVDAGVSVDGKAEPSTAYRLRLTFDFEELVCWREICVPTDYSFYDLHFIIQSVTNWLDYHLYDFRCTHKGKKIKLVEVQGYEEGFWDDDFGGDQARTVDVESLRLDEVFPRTKNVVYSYDYGDGWEIKIKYLGIDQDYSQDVPCCLKGEGDCPPDDVGGEGGFERFLAVIADTKDPEHEEMVEWGKSQGFEHFDLKETNANLALWRDNKKLHNENRGC